MDLLLDGTVERQDFEEKKAKIRLEQIKLEDHIKSARQADDSFKIAMLNLLAFLRNAGGKFKGATVAQNAISSILYLRTSNWTVKTCGIP